jgi:hypothetical protein
MTSPATPNSIPPTAERPGYPSNDPLAIILPQSETGTVKSRDPIIVSSDNAVSSRRIFLTGILFRIHDITITTAGSRKDII